MISNCLENKANLSVPRVNQILVLAAGSELDRTFITTKILSAFEEHLSIQPEFLSSDLATTLAALMELGHYPKTLIDDLMSNDKLNTLPPEGSYILLWQLILLQNTHLPLYNVLWQRLLSDDKVYPWHIFTT